MLGRRRALGAGVWMLAAWAATPALARAGDRAFHVAVVEVPRPDGAPSPPGVTDALRAALLDCGATPLPACHAARGEGSDHDTDGNVVLFDAPASLALRDVMAAAHGRAPAARAVRAALDATSIDAVLLVEHAPVGGAFTASVVWRDGRRILRTTFVWQRANATPGPPLAPARLASLVGRVKRTMGRFFVP